MSCVQQESNYWNVLQWEMERVTVGNFTSHKFTDSDENVYTIKSWSSDNGGKYPSTIDKFYFNGIETNASTPMAHY